MKMRLILLCFISWAQIAFGDPHLKLTKQPLILEEGGTLTRYSVQTKGTEFYFLPPQDWRITLDEAAQKVSFTPRDGSVQFAFKIHWAEGAKLAQPDVAALRAQLLERHQSAKIIEEFTAHASSESGPAFDLTYVTEKNFTLTSRIAFILFRNGIVEFELTTRPEDFSKHHLIFGRLLNSFQIEPAGKLAQPENAVTDKTAPQSSSSPPK